jgi:lipopolysaccharide/colanic/teichoic acid biosynthesis glycosyltransferase
MIKTDQPEMGQKRLACEHERIIVIGSNSLSSLYIKLLDAYAPGQRRVIAVLDNRPRMIGRAISGIPIVGPPQHLEAIVTEYALHGIRTDRVIVGGETGLLSAGELEEIRRVCERLEIKLDFVPRLIGLSELEVPPIEIAVETGRSSIPICARSYLRLKRYIDFVGALILLLLLLPLLTVASLLALLDVGSPVLFWQQRVGLGGRTFLVYKFRTLRPPFDWRGRPTSQDKRLSRIGLWLRESHLDELPQLLNVLVGDMSLVGPRPLLPEDQPPNPACRLMVRPGISGWAQVNGAKLLTPSEKQELDEWYVRNASLCVDLRIILMTLQIASGARRSDEAATDKVRMERREPTNQQEGASRPKHAT